MMAASPALAVIGHNSAGAEPTPYEVSRDRINEIAGEAKHWLTGEPIRSQDEADAVSKLLDMIGDEIKTAEQRRRDENKPFDDGKAEVQARYGKLIGETKSVTGTAILVRDVCRKALTPWRARIEAERQAAAEAARKAAEEAKGDAAFAFDVTRSDDLEGRQRAEDLAAQAKAAEADAKRAGKPVATGLRTVTRAEITDHRAFLRWIAENRPEALRGMLDTFAQTLCAQRVRGVPGLAFHDERVAR
ncbi:hypothetical protein MPPM_4832 [Methylorubrum populi]|uniref:Uncharacterized protein n=1 Tax=Methylorubrum populi TaxID=223967 RepID=A0A160PIU0_9HYPH|nr:hypothetical protein [Methylorubrum populi]BAU93437.1 hypothetical protein MPPM_4832 [Methylorubrum populi]